jgi:ketosteroid isomerase-like protein
MSAAAEDALAIQQLIARYAVVVDSRDFDALDGLFTDDAVVDFAAFGGPVGPLPDIKRFLADALGGFRRTQHLMGLPLVTVDDDVASARTPCTNPMVVDNGDGTSSAWLIGLWYDDAFARTPAGWRFTSRRQERCFSVVGLRDTPLGPT